MGYVCCVPGCKTGYKSNKSQQKISVYRFPQNEVQKLNWIKCIPRKNWTVQPTHRVCALHFDQSDFVLESGDKKKCRREERDSRQLQRCRLKDNAVPHIFANLPSYMSKVKPPSRSSKAATSSARLEIENANIQKQIQDLFEGEIIESFSTFKSKVSSEALPSGYVMVATDTNLQFHYLQVFSHNQYAPKLLASVVISDTLQVNAFVLSAPIPKSMFSHLLNSNSNCIQSTTELSNLLALCKSLCSEGRPKHFITLAVNLLNAYVDTDHTDESALPLIKFLTEQLVLCQCPANGRRYSKDLLVVALLWQLTSTALYKKLSNLFVLPSLSRLCQLSAGMSVECGNLDMAYLKTRTAELSEKERIVVLMIDEVYTAQRIEYSNGSFIGLIDEGIASKTVLTFMVQYICGKYKDVVCLVPVSKLDTNILRKWFDKVMKELNEIFLVIAVSVDNHVCNRKLFVDLCGGQLTSHIQHPVRANEKLFLLFDFTHNFKNIYNNFVNRNYLHPPTKGYEHVLGSSCEAVFHHIIKLYGLEEEKTLKIAYSLKKVSLNPSNIARTSPQHALSVFSEPTVRGLEHYGKTYPKFLETASFVKFILNIWKTMSVKTPFKADMKKDPMCSPMNFADESHVGLKHLTDGIKILQAWKKSGNTGFTAQTFTACIQSMKAVPKLAEYLIENHNFEYLLSGKLMSDPIEGRFGWYRQVNGGNFFMSVKQLLLAEKKIRCLSLIQQQGLLSVSRSRDVLSDVGDDALPQPASNVSWLTDFLQNVPLEDVNDTNAAVTYFVSGYIARSIVRRKKCSSCKESLVKGDKVPNLEDCVPETHKQLFEVANRGGLSEPTEYCFAITSLAVQYYTAISANKVFMQKMLAEGNQQRAFVQAVHEVLEITPALTSLLSFKCKSNHLFFNMIVQSSFNCFAKNELKRLNSTSLPEPPNKSMRTIRKLSSKASGKY